MTTPRDRFGDLMIVFLGMLAFVLALAVGTLALAGCAGVQKMTGAFSSCMKADLGKEITVGAFKGTAEQVIADIVAGDAAAVPGELELAAIALGGKLAIDTIDCAIAALENSVPTAVAGSGAPSSARAAPFYPGLVAARTWVTKQRAMKPGSIR